MGVAMAALALLPKSCVVKEKPPPAPPVADPTPAPIVPITSATTPPIWAPPDPGNGGVTPSSSSSSTPAANGDLAKARTAADAKEFKKVRTILEKKVRAGKGTSEEAQLVFHACVQLKDKTCTEGVKAKHPEVTAE
jgi:hypothetical protein